MPSRDPVPLSAISRGLYGVESIIEQIFQARGSESNADRARQVDLMRRLPCVGQQDQLRTFEHDVRNKNRYIPHYPDRYVKIITTTVGNDVGHYTTKRRFLGSERDAY